MSTDFRTYVIDTYAWVEYLIGSKAGLRAKEYIDSGRAATPSIVVAELRKWYLKEIEAKRRRESEMHQNFTFLETSTQVIQLDYQLALGAGDIDFLMKKRKNNWSIADSIVLATARSMSSMVISGDPHFKDIKDDAIFIG